MPAFFSRPTKQDLAAPQHRHTVLLLVAVLLGLALWRGPSPYLEAGLALAVLGLHRGLACGISKLWLGLGMALGYVTQPVLLTLVWVLVVLPGALLQRLTSRKHRELLHPKRTAWRTRNHAYTAKDLDHPF